MAKHFKPPPNSNPFGERGINSRAAGHGQPHPYTTSLGDAIAGDLLPLAGEFGPAAAPAASRAAKALAPTAAKDALKYGAKGAAAFSLWESLKNPAVWWRIVEGIIGLVLGFMAIKQFTTAASGSQQVVGPPTPKAIPVPV